MATPEQKKLLADALRSKGIDVPGVTDAEAADLNAHLAAQRQQDLDAANIGTVPSSPVTWGAAPAAPAQPEGTNGPNTGMTWMPGPNGPIAVGSPHPPLPPAEPEKPAEAPADKPQAGDAVFASDKAAPPSVIDFPNMAAPAGGGKLAFMSTVSPGTKEKFNTAFAAKDAANLTDFNVAQQNYDTMGTLLKNHQLQNRVQGAIDKGEEDHLRGQIDADRVAADNSADEFKKLSVDPNHFWHTKNTGQKALLILGQGLSDAGAALLGHPELVGKQVNAMIEQDLAAQQANIEKARHSLADQRGALAERYRQLGDMRAAHAAARQDMANELGMQLQEAAQKTGSNTAIARAQQARADLLMQQAEIAAKEEKQVNVGGAAAGSTKQMEANMKMFDSFMKGAVPEGSVVRLPGGQAYGIPGDDGKLAAPARQAVASYMKFSKLADEAIELRNHNDSFIPGTANNARLNQITGEMVLEKNALQSEEGGAKIRMSGPEAEFITKTVSDAGAMKPGTTAALKHASQIIYNGLQATLQSQGMRPVQTHLVKNPWGQVVPYSTYDVAAPIGPGEDVPMQHNAPGSAPTGYTVKPPTVKE